MTPIIYSEELLQTSVNEFIHSPRILNARMREVIDKNRDSSFDIILEYCVKKAWCDAIIYERRRKDSQVIKNASKYKEFVKEDILNLVNNSNINNIYQESYVKYGLCYGIWQKMFNMTLKYLYCFNKVSNIKGELSKIPWNDIGCPVDSIISNKTLKLMEYYNIPDEDNIVYSISKYGACGTSWNKMDINAYRCIQRIIKQICNYSSISSNLFFDFIYWKK